MAMGKKFTKEGLKILAIELNQALWEFVYAATWMGKLEGPAGALVANELRLALATEIYGNKKDIISIKNALASTHYTVATAKNAKGKKEEAREHFRKALKFSDEAMKLSGVSKMSHGSLAIRGSILYQLGHYPLSVDCFQKAFEYRGQGWDARAILEKDLGRSLSALKRKEEAEKHFKKAFRLVGNEKDKTTVRVWGTYSQFLMEEGEEEKAKSMLDKAKKMARELGLGHQELTLKAIKA